MKVIIAVLAVLLVSGVAAEAQRRGDAPGRFYLFGEYDYYSDTASTSSSGGGAGLGWNFNRYLGLEGGGQFISKSGIDLTNFYAQAKFSWPVTNNFSLYASAGGAYARASGDITLLTFPPTTMHVVNTATGYRAGLGADYWLSRHWGLRAGWHRQNAGGVADDIGVGIAFRF
jgi:opacity protein-like surface antigen